MSVIAMQEALFKFDYTRDIQDLQKCPYTFGMAYLMNYSRGLLQYKDYDAGIFYAKRVKKLLGMTLPRTLHPGQESNWGTYIPDGRDEQVLLMFLLRQLDALGPTSGAVIAGLPPIVAVFHEHAFLQKPLNQED